MERRAGQASSTPTPLRVPALPRLGGGAQAPARAPLLSRAQQLTDGSLISPSLIFPRLSIPCPGKPVFSGPIRLENFRNVVGKAAPHCSAGAIQLCPFEQISFFFLLKKKKITTLGRFHFRPFVPFPPPPRSVFLPCWQIVPDNRLPPPTFSPSLQFPSRTCPPSFFSAAVEDPQGKPSGPCCPHFP